MNEHQENLLKEEYFFLQQAYEDFDRRALLIKGWAVTLALGGIAIAFQEKSLQILILSGLVALLFWVLEAMWKLFQYCNSPRIQEIESYFRGEIDSLVPLQAYSTWFETFQNTESWSHEIVRNMFLGPVVIPYAPAVVVVMVLTITHIFGNGVF
jgi:hypothetical protein